MRAKAAEAPQSRMEKAFCSCTTSSHQGIPKLFPAPSGESARKGSGCCALSLVISRQEEIVKTGSIREGAALDLMKGSGLS